MIIQRSENNPILKPNKENSWEAEAVFNGCPAQKGKDIYFLYRALSLPHYHTTAKTKLMVSDIGIAQSHDGIHFTNRRRFIIPEFEWERFGCEDPRVTKLNNKYYIFYTALSEYPFRADGIKVGLAISKNLETLAEKHLVTPFNAKGMALFPEKIYPVRNSEGSPHTSSLRGKQCKVSNGVGGKIWAILTVHTDKPPAKICVASFDEEKDIWSESYWQKWYKNFEKHSLSLQRRPQDQIEVGAPPIKTKYGWLLFYSCIRNYFSPDKLFSVEAVLLDLENPQKIIARTDVPILTPEEYYEKIGLVPNIVFPSGAMIKNNWVYLYYGAADTTCSLALIEFSSLIGQMLQKEKRTAKLIRAKENPIIIPEKGHAWESKAVFNPAAIYLRDKTHLLYRAMSEDNTSTMGYAASRDGIHIDYRATEPAYKPSESFEQKLTPGGNSGAEDPRLTKIGNKIYMCYAAFDGRNLPRVAITWIKADDFLKQKWNWAKPVLISPPDEDDKDAFVFPEKVKGKYLIVHRGGNDIDLGFTPTFDFDGKTWIEEYRWISPRRGWWDSKKVGAAAPPIKTKEGWVMLYHGVSDEGVYRVGALLLDLKNPVKVIGRTDNPIFEPETSYEKEGQTPNVVFPCGNVLLGNTLFVYYGGADQVVGVATIKMDELLKMLNLCKC